MTKQFTGNLNNATQQLNTIIMGMAGAGRVFELLDEEPEVDDGYVTLVNAEISEDGTITETSERTGKWAWKHPHGDGTLTYTELKGDVVLTEVDFGYVEGKQVLHDVSVFAKPGQQVAFVGATGAGKTTITNLINRFYDIADGKIRYDGININKIKKDDLRRSQSIVLQDTHLFTGTVMDNIRYGKLDATHEEIVRASKLVCADEFINTLSDGYDSEVRERGSLLSQGQKQLVSFARTLLSDPAILVLDEATSSIDVQTEKALQKGLDMMLKGRTSFIIAHRLSTIRNCDRIMYIDEGGILESGTHDELMAQKGAYYKLYTSQLDDIKAS